jgi:hypothetical protein
VIVETHVKVLAILYLVFAGLSALFGVAILLITGAVSGIVGTADATGFAIPFIRLGGTAAALFCFVWAIPGFVVGIGLLGRQPWARILGIVISALSLMHVPFGTALGIYGLWILFHSDTERLFAARA